VAKKTPERGRLQVAIIAFAFFGPLLLATWMYSTGQFVPTGTSNRGALLEPVINLEQLLPNSPLISAADGVWLMLYVNEAVCEEPCREALYRQRQLRLMLGKEMDRIVRVFLHGDSVPDTVFIEGEHPGLKTIRDKDLGVLLNEKRHEQLMPGGIYLIDPLANLVMYFPPDLNPGDVVDDMKHLLKLSQIG
jgi:hypothetical protein